MDEDHYDTPWEFLVRPDALRASLPGPSSPPVVQNHDRRRSSRGREEVFVERGVDRVEAEKRLEGQAVGDFLLRASVALSLRGTTSVLHIKMEQRGERWVVGEGPAFRSIASAVHYYRRHPLPIRGAEHLCLKKTLLPGRPSPTTNSPPPAHAFLI